MLQFTEYREHVTWPDSRHGCSETAYHFIEGDTLSRRFLLFYDFQDISCYWNFVFLASDTKFVFCNALAVKIGLYDTKIIPIRRNHIFGNIFHEWKTFRIKKFQAFDLFQTEWQLPISLIWGYLFYAYGAPTRRDFLLEYMVAAGIIKTRGDFY